jgi:inner membrane protein
MAIYESIGILLVAAGAALFLFELVHPGALLFIPASVLLAAGLLYIFVPSFLLDSYGGPVVVIVAALVAALCEIPYYRYVAPTHWPISTTSAGLVGQEAIVISPIVPDTLHGKVRVSSEIWSARANFPIPVGTRVRVVKGEGVSLTVTPIEPPPTPP